MCRHGVTVHRRAIKPRHVDVAHNVGRQHAASGNAKRNRFRIEPDQLSIEPFERVAHAVAVRETTHPYVVDCGGMVAVHFTPGLEGGSCYRTTNPRRPIIRRHASALRDASKEAESPAHTYDRDTSPFRSNSNSTPRSVSHNSQ